MHQSVFYQRQIQSFLAAHPCDEGWKVYEYTDDAVDKLYLRYLPDCLRDCHPQALRRRLAYRIGESDDLMETPGKCHEVKPGGEWDLKHELNAVHWRGLLEIEWKGQPLHFSSTLLMHPMGWRDVFVVAAKSNWALRDCHRALEQYVRTWRMQPEQPEILVVNGEDISILPVPWEDVVLPAGFLEDIRCNVEAFFQSGDLYRQLGIPYRRGFLFVGPPGCGKTLTLKAIAANIRAKFISVLGRFNVGDDLMERAIYLAGKHAPAVILLEDLDKLVQSEDVSLAHFLNLLDGLKKVDGVLVIATSNEPQKLDPALLHRPSRFDRVWRFPLPKYEQRLALLHKRGGEFFSERALMEVARKTEGFSMTYVQEVVVNALLASAHNSSVPDDNALLGSLETLRSQRKSASKDGEVLVERDSLGFCQTA